MDALEHAFFRNALAAGLLASVACGVVGSYVVVKRISAMSGALSHAAFGGVGLGYLLGFDPMIGATAFTLAVGAGIGWAYHRLKSSLDTLISLVWPLGMALGMLFISLVPGYAPDLMSYLFGSILFVPWESVLLIGALDVVILVVVAALFGELRAVAFDEEFARVAGLPVRTLFQVLLAIVALAVVTLIRVVGIILVIALLTIPAAIARQWVDSLLKMMVLATLIGAACTTTGLFVSYWLDAAYGLQIPTGPLVILLVAVLYGASSTARHFVRANAGGN